MTIETRGGQRTEQAHKLVAASISQDLGFLLAKLHAADITRRKKLLEKQKEGRKRLRTVGNVTIEQEAFQKFLSK